MVASVSPSPLTTRGRRGRPVVTAVSRSPLLLEFSDTTLRFGTSGEAQPKHLFVLPPPPSPPPQTITATAGGSNTKQALAGSSDSDDDVVVPSTMTAADWYRYLSPLLQRVYHRLSLDAKDRRVICIVHDAIPTADTLSQAWKEALLRCLLDDTGVPKVCLQPALPLVPHVLPMLSCMLLVQVGTREAACLAHAGGQNLPFTFHSIPLVSPKNDKEDEVEKVVWNDVKTELFLNAHNPSSLLAAILKTLEACPLAARQAVVQNLVFVGEGVLYQPDLAWRVAKRLKTVLSQAAAAAAEKPVSSSRETAAPPEEEEEEEASDPADALRSSQKSGMMTVVPVQVRRLGALAPHVGVVDAAQFPFRPDLMAWAGTSLWSWRYWQRQRLDTLPWVASSKSA